MTFTINTPKTLTAHLSVAITASLRSDKQFNCVSPLSRGAGVSRHVASSTMLKRRKGPMKRKKDERTVTKRGEKEEGKRRARFLHNLLSLILFPPDTRAYSGNQIIRVDCHWMWNLIHFVKSYSTVAFAALLSFWKYEFCLPKPESNPLHYLAKPERLKSRVLVTFELSPLSPVVS